MSSATPSRRRRTSSGPTSATTTWSSPRAGCTASRWPSKRIPRGIDADALRLSAQAALYIALSSVLKLFAPALPHITEECWSWYFQQWTGRRGIHDEPWPQLDIPAEWEADAKLGQSVVDVLAAVRKWKSEHSVSIKKPLSRMTVYVSAESQTALAPDAFVPALGDLLSTCNAEKCSLAAVPAPDGAATTSGNPFTVACEIARSSTCANLSTICSVNPELPWDLVAEVCQPPLQPCGYNLGRMTELAAPAGCRDLPQVRCDRAYAVRLARRPRATPRG